ncbi:collagenase [Niallia sp.]|uniref:tetratricopeptide repeat protein n=1 Tax=Niallia sp. TaxID=2837523 RepID=UPI00289F4209|nr:collagenase [Niallia sp.]
MKKKLILCFASFFLLLGVILFINRNAVKEMGIVKDIQELIYSKPIVEEENALSKKIGSITFKYNEQEDHSNVINEALQSLKEQEKLFMELFGKDRNNPIAIVLIEDPSVLQKLFGITDDGYVAGYYIDEKKSIYLAVPHNAEEMQVFKESIVHEYTHHLISSTLESAGLKTSDIPVWFHEGLAAYVERKDNGITMEEIQVTENASFEELETHKQWNKHLNSPFDPYLQSRLLVGLLIKKEGTSVIPKLMEACKDNNFSNAFEQITGQPLKSYETELFKTLKTYPSMEISARGQLYQDANPEAALESALEMNDLIPNVDNVIHLISTIYLEMGDYEKSIENFDRLVHLFPYSSYYQQYANVLLFTDLDKALEASATSVKLASEEDVPFYQGHLKLMLSINESVNNDNSFKGYIQFLHDDLSWILTNKNKADLIHTILDRYPHISESRDELIALEQGLH